MPETPAWLSGGARRSRGEGTERRILDAGRATFRQYSYEGARVDDIVERAGISHGAFYLYFRNKEDLLHRMAVDCGAGLRELTTELEQMARPSTYGDLLAWVRRFVAVYHDDGPVIRVWMDNRDGDPLMQAMANDSLGPLTRALADLVEPEVRATVGEELAGVTMLSVLERWCSYFADSDEDFVPETVARLLHALTRDPNRVIEVVPSSDQVGDVSRKR